ncbi:hypothetical protein KAU88_04055 [Candidatus Bathyarchaeota archaeon]|nr:hypothetical protein [Candidatus Bathyarchaeota archaeon]
MGNTENSQVEKTLTDLVNLSLSERESITDEAKNHIRSLAKEGALEQYQTKGTIEQWTYELLKKLRKGLTNET